jgi:hypothetical protein
LADDVFVLYGGFAVGFLWEKHVCSSSYRLVPSFVLPKRQSKWKIQRNWQQEEEKHNTICVGHHYTQTNTNDVNKT